MCSRCGEEKLLSQFVRNRASKDGRRPDCKECYRNHRGYERRYRRRTEEVVPEGTRRCLDCGELKAVELFDVQRLKRGKTYNTPYCAECRRARANQAYREDSITQCAAIRDHCYGLEPGEYESLLQHQGGGCFICRKTPEEVGTLSVDHDHALGEIRGLLCHRCNHGIGNFKDNPALLRTAILYLEGHYEQIPLSFRRSPPHADE